MIPWYPPPCSNMNYIAQTFTNYITNYNNAERIRYYVFSYKLVIEPEPDVLCCTSCTKERHCYARSTRDVSKTRWKVYCRRTEKCFREDHHSGCSLYNPSHLFSIGNDDDDRAKNLDNSIVKLRFLQLGCLWFYSFHDLALRSPSFQISFSAEFKVRR